MLQRLLFLALLTVPSAVAASTPDSASVIVYGAHHAFFVDVPLGWYQDSQTLRDEGVCALFYRPGFKFDNAPVVMYVNTADLDRDGIDSFIQGDLETFRQDSPRLTVTPQPTLKTSDGSSVRVLRLDHVGGTTSEFVGYLAAPTVMVVFVASGKSSRDLDREASAFVDLVRSYGWFTAKVKINH